MLTTLKTTSKSRRPPARIDGFTLVELLIVIVVIAILAAITIVAYQGISQRAVVAALSSDLDSASKQLKLDQIDLGGYPPATPKAANGSPLGANVAGGGVGLKASGTTTYQYQVNNSSTPATFCLTATNGTTSYYITQGSSPTAGGCPGDGVGGVAAITNLMTNPSAETNVGGLSANGATIAQSGAWASSGTSSIKVTPTSTAVDTFIGYGGSGGFPYGITPGSTYTISATVSLLIPLTGAIDGRSRTITVYSWVGGSASSLGTTSAAPNTATSTRLSETFTVPSNSTGVQVRLYDGGSNTSDNSVYWDSIMITQGSTLYNYADGNSPNWIWSGATNNSASSGPTL